MKGKDLLEALGNIDIDMVKDAGEYTVQRPAKSYRVQRLTAFAAAVVIIAAVTCILVSRIEADKAATDRDKIAVNQVDSFGVADNQTGKTNVNPSVSKDENRDAYIEANDADTVAEVQKGSIVLIHFDTGVVELNPARDREYFDSVVWDTGNYLVNMEEIFSEAERKCTDGDRTKEDLLYLVQIDMEVPDLEYGDYYLPADAHIKEAEYERLTTECGYDLKWLRPGGYQIPDSYLYCLKNGRIYGTMTEEQIRSFEGNEKYRYIITLISYENIEMEKWDYKENYTEFEFNISTWHSLFDIKE